MEDQHLSRAIAMALAGLEGEGELVITSSSIERVADRIAEAALGVVPNTSLSLVELSGVRSLIFQAIWDQDFFDWEMPTLTGFTADEFKQIAEKLPSE